MALIRQNFHDQSESAINKQINMELYASYVYLALAYNFDRHDVALKGFYEFFKQNSDEEREHAQKLMKYLNERGGRIVLEPVKAPVNYNYITGVDALRAALELEREVNASLLNLHKLASDVNDPHLTDFIEEEFLDEQVQSIKQLGDHITNLERNGIGLGLYMFDKLTLQKSD